MNTAPLTLGPQERLLVLKKLTIAIGLPAEGLVPLAQHASERVFKAGQVAVAQGDAVDSLLVVVDGQFALAHHGHSSFIGPGELVGALEVMSGSISSMAVTAAVDTLALEIPADTLFGVYEDHFSIFEGTLRGIAAGLLADERPLAAAAAVTAAPRLPDDLADADSLVDRLTLLRQQPAFRECRLASLARFAAELTTFTCAPGTRLWSRGDHATWVAFLLHGQLECTAAGAPPFNQGPGAFVGALEAFAQGVRWFNADAITRVVALRLNIERFVDLMEDDFRLARGVLGSVARGALELQRGPGPAARER